MPLPKENLDNKTFDELLKEALSRLAVYAPEWTDHNVHDPGIAFIELFTWLTEMQMYQLNRISEASYKKFLKLLGIPKLRPARTARADVTFRLLNGQSLVIPAGTKLGATDPASGKDINFETKDAVQVVNAQLEAVFSHLGGVGFIDNTEANREENVYYCAFGDKPEKTDKLYLGFDKSFVGEIVLALYLEEDSVQKIDYHEKRLLAYPSAILRWECYTGGDWQNDTNWKSIEVRDETRHLTTTGKIWLKIEEEMDEATINQRTLYWLRCSVEEEGYEIPPKIDGISLNTISAIQRNTFEDCMFSSNGLPNYSMDLRNNPVVENTLQLEVGSIKWKEVEDFDASGPGDRHYTVDLATGRITFGNGLNGKIPPKGENNIRVCYATGGGECGNVVAGAIIKVFGESAEDVSVANEKAASGGEEAETLEQAIYRVRKDMKKVHRAVTSQDYEHLALHTPGLKVARAKAISRYHQIHYREVPGFVTVVIVPHSPSTQPVPSEGFLETVYRHLDKYRLLTTELFVMRPDYVEISVISEVVMRPECLISTVKKAVIKRLSDFLHPITGGTDGKGWPFGRSVYVSEIYETIEHVEGVDYVRSAILEKNGTEQDGDINIPKYGLVFSGILEITVLEKKDIHDK